MTRGKTIAQTLFKTACIGLLSGFVGGVWLYLTIIQRATESAEHVEPMARASYMCSAGSAATLLAFLCPPAGALFGFCLGWFFLGCKAIAQRRPLP